jgi:hypothetical protein
MLIHVCVSNVSMYANVLSLVIIFNNPAAGYMVYGNLPIRNTNSCHVSMQTTQYGIVTQAGT